ncbi:hypothetical protein AWB78_08217 [Caballeronia calidae]|uniref:Uncharacterized protein n=1 Tax=Caballeronia calidae TaxID=1777139 RepID=A0A158EIK8_9BURK|nr:hypothetical protein [Caballeronia calidae]SAL06732.1 hypothetical protein AWB78_08217 [Caballeronia calidae]
MQANSHRPAAPFPLSSLFYELDAKLTQALSDASFLEASQWQDLTRRLNKLRGLLSSPPAPNFRAVQQVSSRGTD